MRGFQISSSVKRLSITTVVVAGLIASIPLAAFADTKPSAQDAAKAENAKYDARVVMVYDHECVVWCGKVKPLLNDLQNQYKSRVQFVELDTSNDQIEASKKTAKAIGVGKFLNENADYAPVIGVFSAKGKLVKELVGPKSKEIYSEAISKALTPQ